MGSTSAYIFSKQNWSLWSFISVHPGPNSHRLLSKCGNVNIPIHTLSFAHVACYLFIQAEGKTVVEEEELTMRKESVQHCIYSITLQQHLKITAKSAQEQKVKCQTIKSLATCQFSWNTCPCSLPANISGLIHIVIAWDWIWLKILKTTQVHWIDFLMKKTQFKLVFTSIWQCTDYNINNSLSFS